MNTHYLVIYNPKAGWKYGKTEFNKIIEKLSAQAVLFDIDEDEELLTEVRTKNAIEKGYRKLIIVGGDGTLNHAVNGVFTQNFAPVSEITLCLIPFGTGNDWRRTAGVSGDFLKAAELPLLGKVFMHDIGVATYYQKGEKKTRYFINIAGMAYDAYVNYKTTIWSAKGAVGKFSYLFNMLRCLFSYEKTILDFEIDGVKYSQKVFSMAVGICKYNGNGMMQCPTAVADDGIFDLTVIGNLNLLQVMLLTTPLYKGTHVNHPKISTYRGKKVKVNSKAKIYLECEGEALGHVPFEFEILPRALNILVP